MEVESNNVIVWNTPNHPKFNLFNKRLESFINQGWPIGLAQTPKTLAEAGFFYWGRGDKVICYYCSGGVHNWRPEDEPWIEHAKHYPNCAYVILVKSKTFIDNIQKNVSKREKQQKELKSIATTSESSNLGLSNENMLKGGKNLPSLQKIVKTYIMKNQSDKEDNSLEQETLIQPQDERMCKLCTEKEANIVFTSCGHLLVCRFCAASLTDCPVCRCKINHIVKVYFS